MSDMRHSLSSSSGNQKCENKPYALKETQSFKKKLDIIIWTEKKNECFTEEKTYTVSELQMCSFMLIYALLLCQGCENRQQNKKAGGQMHAEKF